jgi:hypothetical protein
MNIGVSLSESVMKNETHWRMKMNASAPHIYCELWPERISGVNQDENETHQTIEMNTSARRVQFGNTGFKE